jgi:hypothetical protein
MKATFPDGTVFEGTPEEFLIIHNQPPTTSNGHKAATKAANGTPWTEKNAREFWDSLDVWHNGGKQKKVLRFLISNEGRASEEEVWKHLGIKKGQELAGVLANLTRNARREAHDDNIRVVQWSYDDKHVCWYYIPANILQYLKQFE